MEKKSKNNNRIIIPIIATVCLLLGAGVMYYFITEHGLFSQTVVNKLEKEVTINENGIISHIKLHNLIYNKYVSTKYF